MASKDLVDEAVQLRQLIRKRGRTAIACACVFGLSFTAVAMLSSTMARPGNSAVLWLVYAMAMIALGAAIMFGGHTLSLIRIRRRIEMEIESPRSGGDARD